MTKEKFDIYGDSKYLIDEYGPNDPINDRPFYIGKFSFESETEALEQMTERLGDKYNIMVI